MSQTTREIADSFYALGLTEVVCGLAFVLHIDTGAHPFDESAVGAEDRNASGDYPPVLSIGAHQPIFGVVGFLPLECSAPDGSYALPIVRVDSVHPTGTCGCGCALAGILLPGGALPDEPSIGISQPNDGRRRQRERAVARLAALECSLSCGALAEMIPNFILAVPRTESGLNRADQSYGACRPLQKCDVPVPGKVGEQCATGSQRGTGAKEDDDRKIRPGGLRREHAVQLFGCSAAEGFFGQNGDRTASLQRSSQRCHIRADSGFEAILGQNCGEEVCVTPNGGHHQNALTKLPQLRPRIHRLEIPFLSSAEAVDR